jgi:hypothetical protein
MTPPTENDMMTNYQANVACRHFLRQLGALCCPQLRRTRLERFRWSSCRRAGLTLGRTLARVGPVVESNKEGRTPSGVRPQIILFDTP